MSTTHHCGCCLSRRACLQILSAATLGASALPGAKAKENDRIAVKPGDALPGGREPIDDASLRPRPRTAIQAAILRMPPPYWLGWPGTTYDLEGHEKEYYKKLRGSSKRLDLDLDVADSAVESDTGLIQWIERARSNRPDALLVILQHMSCWNWVERLSQEAGIPLIVFAPVGTAFTGHIDAVSRRAGVFVASTLEWDGVEAGLRLVTAKRKFEESRILWIQGDGRSESVLDRLGTRVRAIPRDTFNQTFDQVPVTEEVEDVASDMRRGAKRVIEPTRDDCRNSARAYITAKRLLSTEKAHALSMDCLGMVGCEARSHPTMLRVDDLAGSRHHGGMRGRPFWRRVAYALELPSRPARLHE